MPSPLGIKVHDLRLSKKLTLDELARLTESSKSYIWELENKPVARPSGEKVAKIAAVLGVTPEFLLDEGRTDPTVADQDRVFFRKYEKAKPEVKDTIKRILDALDE